MLVWVSIKLIACNLDNHLLFERPGGGSNGYDKFCCNYQKSLAYNTGDKDYLFFTQLLNL